MSRINSCCSIQSVAALSRNRRNLPETMPILRRFRCRVLQAKKKRKALEPGGAKHEAGQTGDGVIKTQPSAAAFPSPEEMEQDYKTAYRVRDN